MKRIYFITLLILTLFVANSCIKEIEIDYPEGSQKLVVEAKVNCFYQKAQVKLFNSVGLNEPPKIDYITTAKVSIEDVDAGTFVELKADESGIYTNQNPRHEELWQPGKSYKLHVDYDGKQYESVCYVEQAATIDNLVLQPKVSPDLDETHVLTVSLSDTPGTKNFYQVEVFVNDKAGVFQHNFDDWVFDGSSFSFSVHLKLMMGDRVRVELRSITAEVYQYLSELNQGEIIIGGVPCNPKSNISGDVLGYFSAFSSDVRSVVVGQ